jgi:16S rRNA (guanine966-N2)-methyltransferase
MSGIRITGGRYKGRSIAAPKGGPARFTSAKVREAVFDLLGTVEGLSVLDLFAGSGSFTVEALSRGAASVTAVEADRRAAALIHRNLETLAADKDCHILNMDVRYALPMLHRQGSQFDLIFADPPYDMGHVAATVELLMRFPIYHGRSCLVFEHSKREEAPVAGQGFEMRVRRYGDTHLTLLSCETGDSL